MVYNFANIYTGDRSRQPKGGMNQSIDESKVATASMRLHQTSGKLSKH